MHVRIVITDLPHILRGASSSSNIGWLRKISLDLRQRPLISASVNCTFFPGLDPRTKILKNIYIEYYTYRYSYSHTQLTFQQSLNDTVHVKFISI